MKQGVDLALRVRCLAHRMHGVGRVPERLDGGDYRRKEAGRHRCAEAGARRMMGRSRQTEMGR
jgi:hypothetical protein